MSKNFRELLVAKGLLGGKYGKKETEERSREDPKEKRLREESLFEFLMYFEGFYQTLVLLGHFMAKRLQFPPKKKHFKPP